MPENTVLEIFETSIRTDNPLLCVGYECYDCIDRNKFGNDESYRVLAELECMLDAMIGHPNEHWMWNSGDPGLYAGPHLFWNIVRRLATEVLRLRNWPPVAPDLVWDKFITVGRLVKKPAKTSKRRIKKSNCKRR